MAANAVETGKARYGNRRGGFTTLSEEHMYQLSLSELCCRRSHAARSRRDRSTAFSLEPS
jgi:hypothetical protein